jgi:hypothetical protein
MMILGKKIMLPVTALQIARTNTAAAAISFTNFISG